MKFNKWRGEVFPAKVAQENHDYIFILYNILYSSLGSDDWPEGGVKEGCTEVLVLKGLERRGEKLGFDWEVDGS